MLLMVVLMSTVSVVIVLVMAVNVMIVNVIFVIVSIVLMVALAMPVSVVTFGMRLVASSWFRTARCTHVRRIKKYRGKAE